ncbi:MAG: L-threonylcarbamoyladenylate synthase [Candidatus Paceibacterota bacterium]
MYNKALVSALKSGKLAVLRTDTLYGIVASAYDKEAVEKVYEAKARDKSKACIVLIPKISALDVFGVKLTRKQKKKTKEYWPGPVSLIFDVPRELEYLHRGNKSLAFRLPAKKDLKKLLKKTGPLIAPSANIEGQPPAKNIEEAKKYFSDKIAVYVDEGQCDGAQASKVIRLNQDGTEENIRK